MSRTSPLDAPAHGGEDLARARERFLEALADADRVGAIAVAEGLLDAGIAPVRVLLEVVGPAQRVVGERWQEAAWTVAEEHAATAISEAVVAAVALRAGREGRVTSRGHVVVACVEQEWHALPARVVAEVLSLAGWRTTYLGASTPPDHLARYIQDLAPDAVALSCSLATGLPRVRHVIEAVRDAGVPVVVGGRAFGDDDRLARRLGADAWAASAAHAVEVLATLAPSAGGLPPLDHPGLDERAELVVRREVIVEGALQRLAAQLPDMGRYDEQQLARTREDVGHIVDFLGAALYADDPRTFLGFAAWMQRVLVARHVPATVLRRGLEVVADVVGDLPLARALLAEAARDLPDGEPVGRAGRVDTRGSVGDTGAHAR
jgi:methanogenic corrinoid protein MtbC1